MIENSISVFERLTQKARRAAPPSFLFVDCGIADDHSFLGTL